jgi:CDP-diacylglycerol--glycerol-3-phosphate 3-phosphatidyltransferase
MRDPRIPYPTDYVLKHTILVLIPNWVHPNHITVLRMVLTPFVIGCIVLEQYAIAVPLFLATALTDAVDGAMARLRHQITEWGTIMDPVADKLLIGSAVVVIVFQKVNPLLGALLLFVELVVLIGGAIRLRKGIVRPANYWGKAKMVLECCGVIFLLLASASGVDLFVHISVGTLILAIVFAVMSLVTQSA